MTDKPADDLVLGTDFPAATNAQWRALVERALKGSSFEERLQSRSSDGLTIEPLYSRATADVRPGPVVSPRWQTMARIDHPDPALAKAQSIEELANGADGLVFVGTGALGAHGYGLATSSQTVERVLDGVRLHAGAAVEFDLGPHLRDPAVALATLAKRRGLAGPDVSIRFGFDPIGDAALNGGFAAPWHELGPQTAKAAAEILEIGFRFGLAVADGRVVHGAGGSEAQELAYVLATAVAYLRAFEAQGIALADARRMIFFRLTADADQFLTTAKFRALRVLWARVEESCGLKPGPIFIGAETAWRTMTRDDPYVNILRATIAVFAAGIGGADAITVLPFTLARGLPDPFARRLARNTSLVLLDEAHIGVVSDPTAGTGWSEDLTEKLCGSAWALFQEIEAAGGAAAALEQGLVQRMVAAARAARARARSDKQETLVGANDYRAPDLPAVAVLDVPRVAMQGKPIAVPVEALVQIRLAAPYESE